MGGYVAAGETEGTDSGDRQTEEGTDARPAASSLRSPGVPAGLGMIEERLIEINSQSVINIWASSARSPAANEPWHRFNSCTTAPSSY